ncbi:MAG TPA: PEP-CTERM sorting domain-containing protein, partial [Lacunisphaera sp.]
TNNSPGTYPPLKLYLQGVNSYSGGTTATGGFIIFDGIVALPATGALVTSGSSTSVGNGYIGTTFVELSATFLSRFTAASNWGIIGFDTHEGSGTTTANGVDLTGFNDGVFLGTATSAILSGTLTPSTLTNANNAANTLRLTAGNGGALTVNSTLADGSSALALMLGTPITANTSFSNGIVTLNGISTYTGGTTLNANSQGLTVVLGNNAALGSGTLTVTAPNGGLAGLAAATPGLNIPNAIALTGTSGQLHLMGDNSFTLSGTISGTGTLQFQRATTGSPFAVTLAGDNAALDGFLNLQHGTLTLAHDRAAGLATLNFFDATSVVAMTTTAPVIHGIDTDSDFGTITLTAGANLTIDVSDDTKNHNFGGSILSAAGGAINASVTIDGVNSASADFVYLAGSNQYTGGTTLINRGNLALGSNQSAGTGTITLNSVGSELALNSGVTLTNPIVLTQGGLSGFGVYAPSSFNGVPGGPITIGANQFLSPGFTRISDVPVGTLTLTPNTVFQDGGLMEWGLQDASRTDGSSVLAISGSLDLSSLSAGGFILYLTSFDATGATGLAPLTFGNTYSFSILTAAGGITGFNAANFTIDASSFQNGTMPDSAFSLLQSGNSLVLNFTAVPEPSTWALLTIGAFVLGVTAWRRRAVRP